MATPESFRGEAQTYKQAAKAVRLEDEPNRHARRRRAKLMRGVTVVARERT